MPALRVALLQLASAGRDVAANRERGLAACRNAAEHRADLALFPEMWSVGYAAGFDVALAEPREGPFVTTFRDLARDLSMAIGVTWLESAPRTERSERAHFRRSEPEASGQMRRRSRPPVCRSEPKASGQTHEDAGPRNAFALFDARGECVLHTAKVHLCPWGPPDTACSAGDGFPVATLETRAGPVAVGAMICFDREFPESAKLLALGGAELILVPNACALDDRESGIGDVRLAQLRGRAFENLAAIAMANYAAPQHDGHSCAFRADGSTVVLAGEAEGVVVADLDLAQLRELRRREAGRVEARRPALYGAIAGRKVDSM